MKPLLIRGDIQKGLVGTEDVCAVYSAHRAGGVNIVTPDMCESDMDHLVVMFGSLCLVCTFVLPLKEVL